jgi:hypothetical protein
MRDFRPGLSRMELGGNGVPLGSRLGMSEGINMCCQVSTPLSHSHFDLLVDLIHLAASQLCVLFAVDPPFDTRCVEMQNVGSAVRRGASTTIYQSLGLGGSSYRGIKTPTAIPPFDLYKQQIKTAQSTPRNAHSPVSQRVVTYLRETTRQLLADLQA